MTSNLETTTCTTTKPRLTNKGTRESAPADCRVRHEDVVNKLMASGRFAMAMEVIHLVWELPRSRGHSERVAKVTWGGGRASTPLAPSDTTVPWTQRSGSARCQPAGYTQHSAILTAESPPLLPNYSYWKCIWGLNLAGRITLIATVTHEVLEKVRLSVVWTFNIHGYYNCFHMSLLTLTI